MVITVLTIPVCVFVAVIVTPGIKAREASDTVPPSVAFVVCANAFEKKTQHSSIAAANTLFIDLLSSALPDACTIRFGLKDYKVAAWY